MDWSETLRQLVIGDGESEAESQGRRSFGVEWLDGAEFVKITRLVVSPDR